MTLARALSRSNNIVTIKTLLNTGCEYIKDLGEKFKIPGLQPYPSLALGCVDITVRQAVGFFNVFANGGVYVEPHFLVWIKDKWGNKIYKHRTVEERVISSQVSSKVSKVLMANMERMRGIMHNRWIDSEALGKTGTTNNCRTCWFCGSTPSLTTALYIGCDDNRSMGHNVFPVKTAFPVWLNMHRAIAHDKKKFSFDPSLREITINSHTGAPCLASTKDACTILV
jgi:penicillin-binding protein 1A